MQNAPVSEAVLMQELRDFCARYDTARLAAKALGVTSSVLSLTLNGKANVIPARVLKKLKYKAVPTYVKTGKPAAPSPAKPAIDKNVLFATLDKTHQHPPILEDIGPPPAVNIINITDRR